ncbi:MAG TPA: SusC/RagA family TonB-linked outer membrane protein [Gemmatimonas aurantiaca]|uniref:SusC/RagA family TonB-linked outer membrane protein n=2 Tax=Gemmatimonas aurantiaca TaxID=173480 RepID=A0A3D4VD86_9BACT|nr:SusC/RagA family TonB-linked outer membrane protein [Gemmatimonas aurantiaca]BAH40850.1 putative outer membrane protein [Gemmatimonas aurantiaca T-27]HCT59055.1 SusC/RagA family TonB-linked outer membrane protein [Gemmatimonas aurantiaca]
MVSRSAVARVLTALLFGALCGTTAPLSAQGAAGRVVGTVSDSATGQPLQSVQLFLARGTTRLEARTNADGRYTFVNVPAGSYGLEAIRLGYRRLVRSGITVGTEQLTLDLTMNAAALNLQAVVTTGVVDPTSGTRVPFSVGRVSAEDAPVPATNALETIQGKIAGVSVVPTGQAGSGTNIQLRTPTSISKSNSPLVVVDGVIQSASFDAASADLQSMDIESVEVVKGAAAASLYGSRASAGVIQIRTRRGNSLAEGTTKFTVRSEWGSNSLARKVDWAQNHYYYSDANGNYTNAAGQLVPREQRVPLPVRFQDRPYAPGTAYDQVDRFFDPGNFMRNSLNIAQNGGKTNWFFAYVNQREDGVVLNSGRYDQNDFRFNLDHRPRSDLQFGVSSYYSKSTRQNLYGDVFFDLINQAPDVDLRQPDPDGTKYIFQPDFEGREENPLYVLSTEKNNRNRARLQGSLEGRYTPRSWLTVDGNLSFDRSDRDNNFFLDQGVKTEGYANGGPGAISRFNGITNALNASLSANLLKKVGDFTLRSTVRGLMERETNNTVNASGEIFATPGVNALNNATVRFVSSNSETIKTNSFFVSAATDYRGKLIIDGLARLDGSSLFGPEEQENWYYRASAAYRMSEESWFPFKGFISDFKIRASQGTAGGRPDFSDQYETYNFTEGGGLVKANLGNRFLKPEYSKETEFGFDAIFKNRYSLQISRARQKTTDQLLLVPLAGYFGYANQWRNAGTVEGNSWEGTLEAQLVRKPNFTWRAGLVADRNRNKITDFNLPCFTTGTIGFRCGNETLGNMYGFRFIKDASELPAAAQARANEFQVNDEGLLVYVGNGNSYTSGKWASDAVTIGSGVYRWGQPITAVDSTGSAAVKRMGDGNPDFRFGISNTIGWRNLQVFMLWDAQVGGDVYNQTRQRMYQWGRHADVDQAGKPEELKKPTDYYVALYAANSPTDYFVEDASYVKLRELSLKYRLPSSFSGALARLGASQASLSLIGRNMLTFTKYKGYDPEVGSVLNRLDSFAYPRYRTVTGSVEIIF